MKPWNDHNHYRGEELHDDGYLGPEPVPPVCELCEDANGEYYVDRAWMCEGCRDDYRKDHPDPEEAVAEAEYRRDSKGDR